MKAIIILTLFFSYLFSGNYYYTFEVSCKSNEKERYFHKRFDNNGELKCYQLFTKNDISKMKIIEEDKSEEIFINTAKSILVLVNPIFIIL